jgi:hypothetical protein
MEPPVQASRTSRSGVLARWRLDRSARRTKQEPPTVFVVGDEEFAAGATTLMLSGHGLGFLPDWMGDVTSLTKLVLRRNRLERLPPSCARLVHLVHLDLTSNELSALPEWLGELRCLCRLQLSSNRLATLPASIAQLLHLSELVRCPPSQPPSLR